MHVQGYVPWVREIKKSYKFKTHGSYDTVSWEFNYLCCWYFHYYLWVPLASSEFQSSWFNNLINTESPTFNDNNARIEEPDNKPCTVNSTWQTRKLHDLQ